VTECSFLTAQIIAIRAMIDENEADIIAALKADLVRARAALVRGEPWPPGFVFRSRLTLLNLRPKHAERQ